MMINDHVKAPSFPVVFVFKPSILRRTGPSLLSNQLVRQRVWEQIRVRTNSLCDENDVSKLFQWPGGPPFHAFCEGWGLSARSSRLDIR